MNQEKTGVDFSYPSDMILNGEDQFLLYQVQSSPYLVLENNEKGEK